MRGRKPTPPEPWMPGCWAQHAWIHQLRLTFPLTADNGSDFATSSPTLGVRWPLTVVSVCMSLRLSDAEQLSCACWPFLCLLWRNGSSSHLPTSE